MPACFQSFSCRSVFQTLRSNLWEIRSCKQETLAPATLPPFPSVRSSYLFLESASLLSRMLPAAKMPRARILASRYSRVPGARDLVYPAAATRRYAQACSFGVAVIGCIREFADSHAVQNNPDDSFKFPHANVPRLFSGTLAYTLVIAITSPLAPAPASCAYACRMAILH